MRIAVASLVMAPGFSAAAAARRSAAHPPPLGVVRYGRRDEPFGGALVTKPLVTLDIVLLRRGRAQAALRFARAAVWPIAPAAIRLSRVVAGRPRTSMRSG